jgi:orotate phosphoribosyltransferase
MNSTLINYLFSTKAVKACEADSPFWLTSGKISAFYIDADFLIGYDGNKWTLR